MFKSESPQENGHSQADPVTLTDETGRSLTCSIEHSLELDGQEYVLLLPVDSPVEVFTWRGDEDDEDEEALPVSEAEIDEIFETAKAVLEEQNLTLKRSAITLTVAGDLPDLEEDEVVEAEDKQGEGEAEYEELQWLASFYHKEQEYAIYAPLDPFFLLARINAEGIPELLSPEEFQKLEPMLPTLEGLLEERLFEELE